MSGFLSAYEGSERVELGGGYWVDLKKSLSAGEWQRLQNILGVTKQHVNVNAGTATATADYGAYQAELVALSVADWNLDDEDGRQWPLKPAAALRACIARLPSPVFIELAQKADELNGPASRKEQARFPGGGDGGDPEGDGGAAGTGVVPDPEGVLGAAGGEQGVPG